MASARGHNRGSAPATAQTYLLAILSVIAAPTVFARTARFQGLVAAVEVGGTGTLTTRTGGGFRGPSRRESPG